MAVDLPENVFVSKLDELASWCRKNSLWPMPFATACCGIELMATGASRHDLARFGAEVFRFSPRQCDLMIVAGRVVMKMMPVLERICAHLQPDETALIAAHDAVNRVLLCRVLGLPLQQVWKFRQAPATLNVLSGRSLTELQVVRLNDCEHAEPLLHAAQHRAL